MCTVQMHKQLMKFVALHLQDIGLQWLLDQGRVATEESYPYMGGADFCSDKGKDHIKFSVSSTRAAAKSAPQLLEAGVCWHV